MSKYSRVRQKPKTDKDFIKEAIKTYIAKTAFSKKTKSTKINGFVSLCLAPNLKELLYQNRLHTFGKNKIAWNEFNDKCHSIFTIQGKLRYMATLKYHYLKWMVCIRQLNM